MNSNDKKVFYWLISGAFLVALMVIIGGITRLTQSGLSMVDWKLIMGAIPPLNDKEWNEAFDQYKQFPEYQIKNQYFTLLDFKKIFFWEYLHRLVGRLLGIVFLIPFLLFTYFKMIDVRIKKHLYMLFLLGGFQGFLGWFMVKSGLVDKPDVSHYRLAAHLISAFTLFCYILWVILVLINKNKIFVQRKDDKWFSNNGLILLILTILQIIYGAFVAGLDAGLVYNTYPKMGSNWIAESVIHSFETLGMLSLLENLASVQFIHRVLAHIIIVILIVIFIRSRSAQIDYHQKKSINFIFVILLVQFLLGIFTLLYAVPVWLGVLHQLGALFLLTSIVNYIFQFKKI